jgi:hypothetical protein
MTQEARQEWNPGSMNRPPVEGWGTQRRGGD